MRNLSIWPTVLTLLAVVLLATGAGASAIVVYLDDYGAPKSVQHPGVSDVWGALGALSTPIKDPATGKMLKTAVLSGTKLLDLKVDGDTTTVNFSKEIIGTGVIEEDRLTSVFYQVRFTLRQFALDKNIKILADGVPLYSYTPPVPNVAPSAQALAESKDRVVSTSSLSGRKITLSPGHGWYWNGSGWYTQRPVYCSPLNQEDFHNLEMCQYLETYLLQDGATVKMVRCTDKNYGTHSTGKPWWQMAACYWLQNAGYPCSVYGSSSGCTLGSGSSESSDDIRSRPLASDYDNSDIFVSLHTNGASGDCYGGCPSGTETYYDSSTEHAPWGSISRTLAIKVNDGIMNVITGHYDPAWMCHGVCVKDSNGAYGEIRIPDRAAILTELAFHDSCSYDALYLRDNFFRSAAMWGMYKGICDYFGTTPAWGLYSCELVSDTFPATMQAGHPYTVSLTFRNRGVLWTEAKQIRLGAVGDLDPFTTQTRRYITGEIGPGQTYTFTFNITAPNAGGTYTTDWQMLREGYTWFGPIFSRTYVVEGSPDSEAPTVPQNVYAEGVGLNQVNISWSPSTDNVQVIGYKLFRDGVQIADIPGTYYEDTGRSPNTAYNYTVLAYDAVHNESAHSAVAPAVTHVVVWEDGFPALWTPDRAANGTYVGTEFFDWDNHGSYPGDTCVATIVGTTSTAGSWAYRDLSAAYSASSFDCYLADQAAGNSKQGIHVRGFNGTTQVFSAFLGCYPEAPANGARYSAAVYNGSTWTWATDLQNRMIGWLNLRVEIGATSIRFYINGVRKATMARPANVETFGVSRVNIGHEYNVNSEGYFDDARFTVQPPVAPVPGAATALSTTSIQWVFTDRSLVETAYVLQDASHVQKASAAKNATSFTESGLTANTLYTRHIHGKNGAVEGPASVPVSRYTLSVAPSTSNITCDRQPGQGYSTPDFVFTAVDGFGAGKVQYYTYAWAKSASHTWTGDEARWDSGSLMVSAGSSGSWYLHVKGFNGDDVENGTLTLGPYEYSEPTATISAIKALPDGTSVAVARKVVTANFGAYFDDDFFYIEESDGSSGIRVDASGPDAGELVTLTGTLATIDGERRIVNASISSPGNGAIPAATLVRNTALGGESLNAHTPGVMDGVGANNLGLLLSVAGKVTFVGSGFCYIDDGSMQTQDGSGHPGVRVETSAISAPELDTYVVIKGISSTSRIGSSCVRMLRATETVAYPIQ